MSSTLSSVLPENLLVRIKDIALENRPATSRRLSDLRGLFIDEAAFDAALAKDDPVLYSVSSVEPASGEGQLHYGLGVLYPGCIGDEYFFTKGHYHSQRAAAEIYIGLQGSGAMLLEDEKSGEAKLVPLEANAVVYVPGHTAHRTINTGDKPLSYIGIYSSNAGHDYAPIAKNNFVHALVKRDGQPVLIKRPR